MQHFIRAQRERFQGVGIGVSDRSRAVGGGLGQKSHWQIWMLPSLRPLSSWIRVPGDACPTLAGTS